jgi:hypothetical protein
MIEGQEEAPDDPENLFEWLWRLKRHEDRIFVRAQDSEGKWGNASLATLGPKKWAEYVSGWLEKGSLPVYIREGIEEEDYERDEQGEEKEDAL